MLPALVLAAGASRRMGSPKALLRDPEGQTFVLRICDTLRKGGLLDIVIVTGPDHDRIAAAIALEQPGLPVRLVRNLQPERGQLSSIHAGMEATVSPSTEGVLVTLVDVPFVTPETVRAVCEAWAARRAAVVRPAVGERHGHPVIFDRRLFAELRTAPLEEGAKHVVRAHTAEVENVAVDDIGCVIDVDTPAEYRRTFKGG